jgi:hypothetical protein
VAKHVGGYAVYNTVNLHICNALVGFVSHNVSLLHVRESFKILNSSLIKKL